MALFDIFPNREKFYFQEKKTRNKIKEKTSFIQNFMYLYPCMHSGIGKNVIL